MSDSLTLIEEMEAAQRSASIHFALMKVVEYLKLLTFGDQNKARNAFGQLFMLLEGNKETLHEYMIFQRDRLALPSDQSFFGKHFDELVQRIMDSTFPAEYQENVTGAIEPVEKINKGLERVVAQLPLDEKDRRTVQAALAKHCLMFLPGGEGNLASYSRQHLDLKKTDKICNQSFQGLDYDLLVLRHAHERLNKETIDDIKSDYGHGCDGNCDCSDEDF